MRDPGLPSLSTPKDTISPYGESWYQYFNVVAILCAANMPPNCFPVAVNSLRVATNSLFIHSLYEKKETIFSMKGEVEIKKDSSLGQ